MHDGNYNDLDQEIKNHRSLFGGSNFSNKEIGKNDDGDILTNVFAISRTQQNFRLFQQVHDAFPTGILFGF